MARRKLDGDLVSKTVRLPESLIEYIELQDGDSFSNKLVNFLHECRSGVSERKKQIDFYDRMIMERQNKLRESTENLNQCIMILNKLSSLYMLSLED